MSGYIGNIPVPQATQTRDNFTATSGQTTFSTSGYTPSYLDVYLNGVHLDPSDYTATNGTDVVLGTGAAAGDVLEVVAFTTFTTTSDIDNNSTTTGTLTVDGGDVSFYEDTGTTAKFFWDASAESLGIGTSSPSAGYKLTLTEKMYISSNADVTPDGNWSGQLTIGGNGYTGGLALDASGIWLGSNSSARSVIFATNETERMRIDSSGHLLVNTTNNAVYTGSSSGAGIRSEGICFGSRAAVSGIFNRHTTNGEIIQLRNDGTTIGTIGTSEDTSHPYIASNGQSYTAGLVFQGSSTNGSRNILPCNSVGGRVDNGMDLGSNGYRFDDIYATNGTIQTSDERMKQDIDVMSDAEHNVAVAAKGLIRKYRWKDSVAEKGDDARIHFGVIAQDLKAAFEAEGLDANRYAMFIHTEWWETYTDVPAVEAKDAVLDDDGNVIEEAVEAVDAYTRTNTYDTEAEAPEGAVKKDRMGVRYPELLAFIIGAL